MTRPEALRLADLFELEDDPESQWREEAAAELRRLHAENEALREEVAELRAWFEVEAGQLKRAVAAEHQARQRVIDGLKLLHDSLSMASKENKV